MLTPLKTFLLFLVFILIVLAVIYTPKFYRFYQMIHLYDEGKISENFINMDKIFDTIPLSASPTTFTFDEGTFDLPETFIFEGKEQNLQEALDYFETDGLIVLSGNKKIYENYWHGNTKDSKHISSLCRRIVGHLLERQRSQLLHLVCSLTNPK